MFQRNDVIKHMITGALRRVVSVPENCRIVHGDEPAYAHQGLGETDDQVYVEAWHSVEGKYVLERST